MGRWAESKRGLLRVYRAGDCPEYKRAHGTLYAPRILNKVVTDLFSGEKSMIAYLPCDTPVRSRRDKKEMELNPLSSDPDGWPLRVPA